jgi:hypothetical protein
MIDQIGQPLDLPGALAIERVLGGPAETATSLEKLGILFAGIEQTNRPVETFMLARRSRAKHGTEIILFQLFFRIPACVDSLFLHVTNARGWELT